MRLLASHRRLARLAALAALAAVTALTAPASAQFGQLAGFTEAMQPEYLRRDLVIFAESLELDKSQKDVLESLYADYQTSFESGLDEMQQRLRDMKKELQTGDQRRILSMIFVPFEEWAQERRKLGETFVRNVEVILNEQQLLLLPAFQRRLVREKTLSQGLLSGESLNLLLITRQLEIASRSCSPSSRTCRSTRWPCTMPSCGGTRCSTSRRARRWRRCRSRIPRRTWPS